MPKQLPEAARSRLESNDQPLLFSVASLWEAAIKSSLARERFQVDPTALRLGLLQESFRDLLWIHRAPFDRLLVAQAQSEVQRLCSADRTFPRLWAALSSSCLAADDWLPAAAPNSIQSRAS